jgi:hypothetical protein
MTLPQKEEEPMITTTAYVSRYEKRVKLVEGIVREDTGLSPEQSHILAVRLLHTLDTLPETLR